MNDDEKRLIKMFIEKNNITLNDLIDNILNENCFYWDIQFTKDYLVDKVILGIDGYLELKKKDVNIK